MGKISDFFNGLKSYSTPVTPNFKPIRSIVPASWFENCRPWKGIVIHHSATVDGKTNEWAGIRKYHMSYRIDGDIVDETTFKQRQMLGQGTTFEKPWSDIGYHGGWELEGDVYVFKIGRSWSVPGAHAGFKGNSNYNDNFLGLCAVGNFDKTIPPVALWDLAVATVKELKQHFSFGSEQVLGHREVYDKVGIPRQKTCPGEKWSMDKFRAAL